MSASIHGAERLRKRGGLPKRSIGRTVQIVLGNGKEPKEFAPPLRVYLERKMRGRGKVLVHGNMVYFFKRSLGGDMVLTTCYPLPGRYTRFLN